MPDELPIELLDPELDDVPPEEEDAVEPVLPDDPEELLEDPVELELEDPVEEPPDDEVADDAVLGAAAMPPEPPEEHPSRTINDASADNCAKKCELRIQADNFSDAEKLTNAFGDVTARHGTQPFKMSA